MRGHVHIRWMTLAAKIPRPLAAGRPCPDNHSDLVLRLLQPGDIMTHTRCAGCLEEHVFLGLTSSGRWLRGRATIDTLRLGGSGTEVDDISPRNVTHINRVPVDMVELLAPSYRERLNEIRLSSLKG